MYNLKGSLMKKSKIFYIAIGVGLLGIAFYTWSGNIDIAADKKHWKVTEWFLGAVRDRSIQNETKKIVIPPNINDLAVIVKGAGNYDSMCSSCHFSPGTTSSEINAGLYPQPPDFTQSPLEDPARSFWVIKHGIKMTGMPAWGSSHSDEEIWELVAFIHQIQKLDQRSYEELVSKYGGSHQHENGQGHGKSSTNIQKSHSDGHSHEH